MINYAQQSCFDVKQSGNDNKIWNTAIYVRLSKEDGDKEESDSIVNQKALIRDFAKTKPELQICDELVDDGYSGVDFNRPSFMKMMDDVKNGKINCIIVKDLSRFGRNYIEAGKYIQKIFPFLGVRFIAITDGYDSEEGSTLTDNIIIPFKNLINDSYSRDTSIKIRSQLEIKRKKGDFIGSFTVFGYKKSETDKNRLEIDECAAQIVKDIFKWKLEGMSQQGIADKLNELGILSPMEYKRSLGKKYKTAFKIKPQATWSAVAVRRILTNEIYIGVLIQGKTTTPNYKVKKNIERPKEEWVRIESNHEPIISLNDFNAVNGLMEQTTRIAPNEDKVYPFSGIIFCGDCLESMIRKTVASNGKKYYYFTCSTNRIDKSKCTTHNISEQAFEKAVINALNIHIKSVIDVGRVLQHIDSLPYKQDEVRKIDTQIIKSKEEIEKLEWYKLSAHENFADKIITLDEFNSHTARYNAKIRAIEESLLKRQQEIEQIIENTAQTNQWIESFRLHRNIDKLTRKIVISLIDKVYVYENGKIDIRYKYTAQYENAISFIESAVKSNLIDDSFMIGEVQ